MLASLISAFVLVAVFTIFNNYFQQNFTFSDIFFSDISVAWLLSVIGIMTTRKPHVNPNTYPENTIKKIKPGKDTTE